MRSCFLPYILFSHTFCFVLVFLRKQWGLSVTSGSISFISSPVLLVFTTSFSKILSSFLGSKNSLQIPFACTLFLKQVMTEHSDLVAFPTAMDINISNLNKHTYLCRSQTGIHNRQCLLCPSNALLSNKPHKYRISTEPPSVCFQIPGWASPNSEGRTRQDT